MFECDVSHQMNSHKVVGVRSIRIIFFPEWRQPRDAEGVGGARSGNVMDALLWLVWKRLPGLDYHHYHLRHCHQ